MSKKSSNVSQIRRTIKYYVQDGRSLRYLKKGERFDAAIERYLRSIQDIPTAPMLFLPSPSIRDADLVIFTGGPDVTPELYGQRACSQTIFHVDRDANDLMAWQMSRDKFKLGICRGAQFLNVMNGGSLWQHVDNHTRDHAIMRDEFNNVMETEYNGTNILNSVTYRVTSTHHQQIIPGPKCQVLGTALAANYEGNRISTEKSRGSALDGSVHGRIQKFGDPSWERDDAETDVEIVFYPETFSLCVQGHPEYPDATNEFATDVAELLFRRYLVFETDTDMRKRMNPKNGKAA